ncbi:HipA domain-containing protein [Mesobacillus sp.]|uniref:HipA domain-containing protein n=1 Tax=Mesobacillus sp. TaxID=2675271 RepID=UPI0039EEB9E7
MLRDVSEWFFESYGEKSTLSKEELSSPDGTQYIIKYPREFKDRINWEDVNEIVAAQIAKLLGLKTIQAEVAYRKGKRGCLMLHFVKQYDADFGEPGATLLEAELEDYKSIQNSEKRSEILTVDCFTVIQNFSLFQVMKEDFVNMQVYDILIGNQDRHPYNWQLLFKDNSPFFGPLYDNGASLGWQLSDEQLRVMNDSDAKLNKYFKNTKVKAGLIEDTQAPLKAKDILHSCNDFFPDETARVIQKLEKFNFNEYNFFIDAMPLISTVRKEFLKKFILFRLNKILTILRGDNHE